MVAVSDILDPHSVVDEINRGGGKAIGMIADVADLSACETLAQQTVEAFGRIDALVTNAALFASLERKSFDRITASEWDAVMDVNVRGPFHCAQAVFPHMKRNGYGKIVNIASATVFSGTAGMLHYVTSKGAIVAFTRALARELGEHGILVNAIAPGLTMSEGIRAQEAVIAPFAKIAMAARSVKREQLPADLLGTLIYLVAPDSDFVTGQTIVVDGGYVMN